MRIGMELVKAGEGRCFRHSRQHRHGNVLRQEDFWRHQRRDPPLPLCRIPRQGWQSRGTGYRRQRRMPTGFPGPVRHHGEHLCQDNAGQGQSLALALVSNGEEEGKGNNLVRETFPLLEASDLNFVGNIEGKELFGGTVDVAVTDGFTGNVLLKSTEAVAKLILDVLKEELMGSLRTKMGALLAKPAFNGIRKMLDPAEIGAAPLLGIDAMVFRRPRPLRCPGDDQRRSGSQTSGR